jgi:hypothetical protein
MRTAAGKKGIHLLLAFLLAIGLWPPAPAAAAEPQETKTNLLAADMDTGFDGGTSPFTLEIPTSGGSQQIVQIGGNNALEFRDASLGANANSYFFYELTGGALLSRINDIYRMPVGTTPTEFVFEYKLLRSAASSKPVPGNTYAQLQMAPYDNVSVPRFPADYPSITGTAAYTNTTPNELKTINDEDLPSYRFSIVPNGGQKLITSFKIAFSIRVDTGATDEAYVIDDLAIYEAGGGVPGDDEAPSAPSGLTATDVTDTSVKLSWTAATDNTGVTKYDIYRNGALLASVSGSTLTHTVAGLSPNTTYRFTVKAGDGGGNVSPASNEATATTEPSPGALPEPFGNGDIGDARLAGDAVYDEETDAFTVRGSGADIWGNADAFHYVYRPWKGDGQIVARISGMSNTVAWTKAGVMIRGGIAAGSPNALMMLTGSYGTSYQSRLQTGGATTQQAGAAGVTAPYWLKLTREGSMISSYHSIDGKNWTLVKREGIALGETAYFGLAVTSHDNNKLSSVVFDNVSVGPVPAEESSYAPQPGTLETRREWLWNKTKSMSEVGGQLNISQIVAQLLDGQNETVNLQKLNTMFQSYDWEQYKTVAKMYAYLLVGDKFDSALTEHVRDYFASYAYAKLPQTENLRMSNYAAGYLVGQYFPDLEDLNGVSGAALKSSNRANVEEMLDAGVRFGWAEYESPEYTFMTYLCLNALYQFTDEPDFKQKVKMAMDVMWFEWANDWIDGIFISTSNRAKGDAVSANDPSWRGADHTALSWMYFGSHRAQQKIGESDAGVPASYRPFLEYLGMAVYEGMEYEPPAMAVELGQLKNKDYMSRKTNMQNSSGRLLNTYRQAYVKPTWGLSTEVTYNRQDNWIEEIPVALRWQSDAPNPLFRVNADQPDAAIGNYNQPENHRIMQDAKAALGVYKSLKEPGAADSYLTAMFPDTGSILEWEEQDGWVFNRTEQMYFAFKMIKPYTWHYQTPTDPADKVKPMTPHPTKQLHYNYNILRSKADTNGWVLDTAEIGDYDDLDAFKNAILTETELNADGINAASPRLVYTNLSGNEMDITFDRASGSYADTHRINGEPIDYDSFKLFDTPWLQQERGSELFAATYGEESLTYNFGSWTVTSRNPNETVAVTGVAVSETELTLGAGKSFRLHAEFKPADATNRNVVWSSSRPSVAAVSGNGTVTGVAPGTAVITVTTEDGSFTAETDVAVVIEPLFEDGFENGIAAWDLFGSADWRIEGSGAEAKLTGSTLQTGPQRAVVKSSLLPYASTDYSMSFTGAGNRFRAMFRYSSGTSYYFLEFKDGSAAELWKYPGTSTPEQVGAIVQIGDVLPGFALMDSHDYVIEAEGGEFRVFIDGTRVATFEDDSLAEGGVGFSVKSVGSEAKLAVDRIRVMPLIEEPAAGGGDDDDDNPPAGGGNEGPPAGSGTGNGSSTGNGSATETDHTLIVPADKLQGKADGTIVIAAPAGITEVRLPAGTSELVGDKAIEIRLEELSLVIPSSVIRELTALLPEAERANGTIKLTLAPLPAAEAQKVRAAGERATGAVIRLGSAIYELGLSIEGKASASLTQFPEPVTIRLKADSAIRSELAGIYYLPGRGRPEYVGGDYANGWWTAEVRRFSRYAVLEVAKSFDDLPAAHWAYNVVRGLYAKGIVQGTGASTFAPERTVTRAEFAAMLVNALGLTKRGELPFEDVPADAWFAEPVAIAYQAGIVAGKGDANYDPNGLVTREEMAVMAMRAIGLRGETASVGAAAAYSDESELSPWAVASVKEASELGLLLGRGEGRFAPKNGTTRAEAAQVLHRLLALT